MLSSYFLYNYTSRGLANKRQNWLLLGEGGNKDYKLITVLETFNIWNSD